MRENNLECIQDQGFMNKILFWLNERPNKRVHISVQFVIFFTIAIELVTEEHEIVTLEFGFFD